MTQRLLTTFSATLLLLTQFGFASAQNGKVYTLEECIQLGLKNNSVFRNAINRVDRAGANVKGSYASVLPQITSTFQSGRNTQGKSVNVQTNPVINQVALFDTAGRVQEIGGFALQNGNIILDQVQTTSPTASFWGHSVTLNYNQTLFDFGRSWYGIKQAKASYEASSQSLTAARHTVYSEVKQRYLELLKALKLEQEYTEAVARSKGELQRTQSMFEIGSVAKIDVYRQEVTLGRDEISLINQENAVKIARGNLNVVMGREPEEPVQIVDIQPGAEASQFSLEEAYNKAERNNPQLQQFEFDMKSAEYGRKAAKGSLWPSIGIGATYSRNNQSLSRVYGDIDQNYFLTVGASVSFNIFNGFSDVAEIGRQSANYSIAKENWLSEKRNLHLRVKQAYLNLQGYNRIAKINETMMRSAEEEYRLAQERYRVGAGTQLEVTEAQVSLTRARVQVVSSKYDAMIAQAQLEAALGTVKNVSQN